MFRRPGPYYEVHHAGGHPWFGFVLFLLLVAALALAIVILWRAYRQPLGAATVVAPNAASGRDPALGELRLRYARGEIDREEYLQRATDLGDAPPPPTPTG